MAEWLTFDIAIREFLVIDPGIESSSPGLGISLAAAFRVSAGSMIPRLRRPLDKVSLKRVLQQLAIFSGNRFPAVAVCESPQSDLFED